MSLDNFLTIVKQLADRAIMRHMRDADLLPNPKADVAPASGAHVQRVVGCELSTGEK